MMCTITFCRYYVGVTYIDLTELNKGKVLKEVEDVKEECLLYGTKCCGKTLLTG